MRISLTLLIAQQAIKNSRPTFPKCLPLEDLWWTGHLITWSSCGKEGELNEDWKWSHEGWVECTCKRFQLATLNSWFWCDKQMANIHTRILLVIFTTRRSYASAVLGVAILSVCLSVCLSLYYTRALWLIQRTYRRYFIPHEKAVLLVFCHPTVVGGRHPLPPKTGD